MYFQVIAVDKHDQSEHVWAEFRTYQRAADEVEALRTRGFFSFIEAPEGAIQITTE